MCSSDLARVDDTHANPERAWREMGAPTYLKAAQVAALMTASEATPEPIQAIASAGALEIDLVLAPQSVNHLLVEWMPSM